MVTLLWQDGKVLNPDKLLGKALKEDKPVLDIEFSSKLAAIQWFHLISYHLAYFHFIIPILHVQDYFPIP